MTKHILSFSILTGILSTLPMAQAETTTTPVDPQYYTIQNIETHEITEPDTTPVPAESVAPNLLNADLGVDIGISDIINIGKEIWTIVQANKPVVNVTTNQATAIPKGITDWTQLAGWQAPQIHTFQTTFTNAYGINVVQFQYRVTYTPGGTYKGKGKFLANITVNPADLYVAWGYTFSVNVTIPSITNAGTTTSPIAAAEVLVSWTVDTVINHEQQTADYYVRGDGTFQTLQ